MRRTVAWIGAVFCVAVAAASGQQRTTVAPTAALAGRVIDHESGQPLIGARVTLLADDEPLREVLTGRDGTFTFPQLPRATYEIRAFAPGYLRTAYGQKKPERSGARIALAEGERREGLTIGAFRGAVLSGRVVGENSQPLTGATVEAFLLAHHEHGPLLQIAGSTIADDGGSYRLFGLRPGEYFVRATPTAGSVMHLSTPSWNVQPVPAEGYVRTFYPAADEPASATPVSVAAGAIVPGIDLRLSLRTLVNVRGRLIGPPGFVVGGWMRISDDPLVRPEQLSQVAVAPDGTFAIRGVAPGNFMLSVAGFTSRTVSNEGRLWGSARLSVSSADVSDVQVPLRPGVTLSGTIVADRGSVADVPREGFGATALGMPNSLLAGEALSGDADRDGRFSISGLPPGRYQLFAHGGRGMWQLSSAALDGRALSELALDAIDNVAGIVLIVSDRRASLSGEVEHTAADSEAELSVLAFPADPEVRAAIPRRVYQALVDSAGTYSMSSVLPGRYLIVVAQDLERQSWYDTRVLDRLAPEATAVIIAPREAKVQNLRFVRK